MSCSPFLEYLTEGIDKRLEYNLITLSMMGLLVPSVIAVKDEVSISEASELYKHNLPRLTYWTKSSEDGKISGGQK